jgi:hypothetical protein
VLAVLAFVGWMVVAGHDPSTAEVLCFLGLVVAALLLISGAVLLQPSAPGIQIKGIDQ